MAIHQHKWKLVNQHEEETHRSGRVIYKTYACACGCVEWESTYMNTFEIVRYEAKSQYGRYAEHFATRPDEEAPDA